MITTIMDKTNGAIFTQEKTLGDDIEGNLMNISMSIFDFIYNNVFDENDDITITIKVENHDEYHMLDKMIAMEMENMENEPVWFDRMLLIALINAKYDYLYDGYEFDDEFEEFKEARGL